MISRRLIPLVLLLLAGIAQAQQPEITPETPVTPAQIHQWLHSGDPRLIAWGADFARRTHDNDALNEMRSLLLHWTTPPLGDSDSMRPQRSAILAVLDGLIEEKVKVPTQLIDSIVDQFPAQAAILISRLPLSDSRDTLTAWTYGNTAHWSAPALARIAAMLLAREPDGNIVATILSNSEEQLTITLIDGGGRGFGSGVGGMCGDSLSTTAPTGWPIIYTYDLVENAPYSPSIEVVSLDADHIAARRFEEHRPLGSCNGVTPLNAVTRHRIIAHWLGLSSESMAWHPAENASIVWTNRRAYERELGRIVEAHRRILHGTVESLHRRGLSATPNVLLFPIPDAAPEPKLIVTIQCRINPCPLDTH